MGITHADSPSLNRISVRQIDFPPVGRTLTLSTTRLSSDHEKLRPSLRTRPSSERYLTDFPCPLRTSQTTTAKRIRHIRPIPNGPTLKPFCKPMSRHARPIGTKKSPSRPTRTNVVLLALTSSRFISSPPQTNNTTAFISCSNRQHNARHHPPRGVSLR